jgi:hypothetical protein
LSKKFMCKQACNQPSTKIQDRGEPFTHLSTTL